jgi:hypothetical protein
VYERVTGETFVRIHLCRTPGCVEEGEERYSIGLPAGWYCDHHYETAFPYKKDAVYAYLDAGEYYDDD